MIEGVGEDPGESEGLGLRTSPSKEGTRRHFLDKKILWTSFLYPNFPSALSFTMGRAQIMASFHRNF